MNVGFDFKFGWRVMVLGDCVDGQIIESDIIIGSPDSDK
jgi:hypothetical protein